MIITSFFFNIIGILIPSFMVRTVWKNWHLPVSLPLTIFIFAVVIICILNLLGLTTFASDLLFHENITLVIGFTTTALWFWVTYEFIMKKKLTNTKLVLIWIEPILMILISLTNDQHGMFTSGGLNTSGDTLNIIENEFKIFRILHMIYSLSLITFSISWLAYYLYHNSQLKIIQITLLVTVLCLPTISFFLYVVGIIPVRIGAPLSIVLILLGIYRFKVLDIIPIARDQIVDHMSDGVAIINAKGQLVDANKTALTLLQLPLSENSGIHKPMKLPDFIGELFNIKNTEVQRHEMTFSIPDSTIKSAEVLFTPLLGKHDQVIGGLLSFRDITEQKEAAAEREKHIETIEKSRHKLTQLAHFKSDFLANISHEFRTPITLSLGIVKDVSDGIHGNVSKNVAKQLMMVSHHNQRLLDLINQLLSLSHLESVESVQSNKIIDWVSYIPTTIAAFENMAKKSNISLVFETTLTSAPIKMDYDNIEKIINNLVSNALKNSFDSGVVTISLNNSGNDMVQLKISDSGRGISQDALPHIFERFYYDEHVNSHWSASTGIGLAIVKQIIDSHGGEISVKSTVNIGSTFSIKLPICQASTDTTYQPSLSGGSDNTSAELIRNRKENINYIDDKNKPVILLIEDNKDMRNYLRNHLIKVFNLIEASNGNQGLEKAITEVPDIIISDIMMPGLDGYSLCESVKKTVQISHIPIILLTAKSSPKDKLKGLFVEADDYLTKPFDMNELIARANNLIAQRIKLRNYYCQVFTIQSHPSSTTDNSQNNNVEEIYLHRLQKFMFKNLASSGLQTIDLAKNMCTSERQLQRKIKALTGKSPMQWLLEIRLQFAAKLLKESTANITHIVENSGFNSSSYFAKKFKQFYKKSPSEYRATQ